MNAGVDAAVREHAEKAAAYRGEMQAAPMGPLLAVAHELAAIRILLAAYMEDR